MSLVRVVFCQITASGWSLVQRSPTECGVCECDLEASITRRLWLTCAVEGGGGRSRGTMMWNLLWFACILFNFLFFILRPINEIGTIWWVKIIDNSGSNYACSPSCVLFARTLNLVLNFLGYIKYLPSFTFLYLYFDSKILWPVYWRMDSLYIYMCVCVCVCT